MFCNPAETCMDPHEEIVALALDPVATAPAEALTGDLDREVEEHDEIGEPVAVGPTVQLPELVDIQAAPIALVGKRRARITVADHIIASRQSRLDDLSNMLGAGSQHEECLSSRHRCEERLLEEKPAQGLADGCAARLAGEHCSKVFGK
jgi:hypothetical protein